LDSALPQPAALLPIEDPIAHLSAISGLQISKLWRDAEAGRVGLTEDELATVLLKIGAKCNYGFAAGVAPNPSQVGAFFESLQIQDVALAHACALGRDAAWALLIAHYREPLTQAAIAITRSSTLGQELADSLYADLFGLTARGAQRVSPLSYYSGRGSLKGFLRTTLAQRHVDYHRRARREAPLPDHDLPAEAATPAPPNYAPHLEEALATTLRSLGPEERFLVSAWFLDRRTLLDISRLLHVHEATVSRRLHRLTSNLHEDLLKNLQALGLSDRAAQEALETDPRDLDTNLRALLQASQSPAFPKQEGLAREDRT
jgi:RNA polymerase sigma-70 factor (ECF subfamily)